MVRHKTIKLINLRSQVKPFAKKRCLFSGFDGFFTSNLSDKSPLIRHSVRLFDRKFPPCHSHLWKPVLKAAQPVGKLAALA
jgi:hypothetical protein